MDNIIKTDIEFHSVSVEIQTFRLMGLLKEFFNPDASKIGYF